jgi:hypothetical protein
LEILKQISEVKSNVKMKASKCLIILDLGKHIYVWTFNVWNESGIMIDTWLMMKVQDNL